MLQPRESRLLWRRRKRRQYSEGFYCSKIYFTLIVIGCLALLPQGQTQHNDDVYIVKPTPALRLGKEDLTTVLLVNNENQGRYINIRPEVGLLTSTARTFIQEGVTTEYATQVVGTTLDNGRVYAQYLKKSSRVLYDSSVPLPSVVTSWVGESLHSDAGFVPLSHNDIVDEDKQDWQSVDDGLLGGHRNQDNFVGNTDYVGLRRQPLLPASLEGVEEVSGTVSSHDYLPSSKSSYKFVAQLGVLDDNAQKVAANKVLPIGDLPTYTIKQNYDPKAYIAANNDSDLGEDNSSGEAFGRNPKLIYKKLMQSSLKSKNKSDSTLYPPRPGTLGSMHFATVTYYGFADFTTVVGDSIIVFSPSTSTNNMHNNAQVTSIKGEATLGESLPPGSSTTKVPIIIAQDIIEPTIRKQSSTETLLETAKNTMEAENKEQFATASFTSVEIDDSKNIQMETLALLETSEVVVQTAANKITIAQATAVVPSVMLSRPSDEEILRIFNALAKADANNSKTKLENSTTLATFSTFTDEISTETPSVQIFGGATTVFFEDDPFANFVVPSHTSVSLDNTATLHTTSQLPSELSENIKMESLATTTTSAVSTERAKLMETTKESQASETTEPSTDQPLKTSQKINNTDLSNPITTSEPDLLNVNSPPNILTNILIKEIDTENVNELPSDCISTSQVFLTQLPKTITYYETISATDTLVLSAELKTEIRQQIKPTFEIKEATKYYCIQAPPIQSQQIEDPLDKPNTATTEKSDLVDRQSDTEDVTEKYKPVTITTDTAEENIVENKTEDSAADNEEHENRTEQSNDNDNDGDELEASGQLEEEDEEIELIYKTLYTTYTYLTTFFHDDSTSISSHTEVVTNVMTSTLGISASQVSSVRNFIANLDDNEINPSSALYSAQMESSKRFMVPSEVNSLIRSEDETQLKSEVVTDILGSNSLADTNNLETLATFYTTYTYYTTIFAEGETEIMSHTEVITNIKKGSSATATAALDTISPTMSSFPSTLKDEVISSTVIAAEEITNIAAGLMSTLEASSFSSEMPTLPIIPDLGDLPAITLVTDVRSSSSPGEKQFINKIEEKILGERVPLQQQAILEDQISSESNTETDEIIPSPTLLLQTSFTTFTYYTTMYSGDKTNVISRLETMTNMVTETLQPTKTIDLEGASVPITYFTTFTYWTKLAKEGQITTLSREETISNVIVPTIVQQETQTQIENRQSNTEEEKVSVTQALLSNETTINTTKIDTQASSSDMSTNILNDKQKTNVLEPTTYYTTYTYYTTSYETDKTITDSRFETVTNVITPTLTQTNTKENSGNSVTLGSSVAAFSPSLEKTANNTDATALDLILYDFKQIVDADGISTIFFTTEIKPTTDLEGLPTEIISSSSSLLINEDKRHIQATAMKDSLLPSLGSDGQLQKQYKTGLVRLIEGTRIANRTTTLYQSKVIGTVIDQRYAQIIESTSSFIFEKTKTPLDTNSIISPTSSTSIENIQETKKINEESFILDSSSEPEIETTTKQEVDENEDSPKTDEKLRFPFQTKKSPFISPLKSFPNRNRPQFAPKKNSSATIITRSDFTPTITATPALKTVSRFLTTRRGSASGISGSHTGLFSTTARRFGRPSKSSITGTVNQGSSSPATGSFSGPSRNRFASSSSNVQGLFASSSRRLRPSAATIKPSFSRPTLYSSNYPINSRVRTKTTTTGADLEEVSPNGDISTPVNASSQEEGLSQIPDESDDEGEITTESNRRQNNPLLRLRRPLNRPQGFAPARAQANSPSNAVSLRRNPLTSRSRSAATFATTTTTTTSKPKPRTFPSPLTPQNRLRTTNALFPRYKFGIQKPTVTTEENRDLSEEDTNENNDDSEYEDDDEEESEGDDEEENSRRRRSNNKTIRKKREADSSQPNRSNFRNRFRRPKLASSIQAESRSFDDDGSDTKKTVTTDAALTTSTQKNRSRFGARHSSSSLSTTAASTSAAATSNHKAIRPTRPTNNNGGRAQFTLREKDSAVMSGTQKGFSSNKRPAFRRPQPGGGGAKSTRRLPSSTVPSSSTSGKRRLKSYTSNDATTTSRNSVTGRSRPSSTTSSRLRSGSGSARDSNIGGRNRGRNNHNEALSLDDGGTITITHVIPTEVTIPVVNGKITEYKQVVTAKTSTEVILPQQYTTTIAGNGLPQLALTREDSSVNYNGATEVTKYILHETPTTSITFTPTTIRGRKTSFSHVLPSTIYSVEQVVATVQPQISANAPLANILLSQLLLGNVGIPAGNPLLGALGGALTQPGVGLGTAVTPAQPATPVTEYKTHASTYVTTLFEGKSTVVPLTFQGKKILTTIFDTTGQTITATEFITDTIVTTPTVVAQAQPVVNSLLLQQLLLQQHLQQQQQLQQTTPDSSYPLNGILNSVPPQFLLGGNSLQELEASNNIRGSGQGDVLNEEDDFSIGSSVDLDDIALQAQVQTHKSGRKKSRKNGKNHKRKNNNNAETQQTVESSVITLYVSGRRPGEFSTVLSTVQVRPESTQYKRHAHIIDSATDFLDDGSEILNEYIDLHPEIILLDAFDKNKSKIAYINENKAAPSATQSLESIVGDVSLWYVAQTTATKANTLKISGPSTEIKNQMSSYDTGDVHVKSSNQHFFA